MPVTQVSVKRVFSSWKYVLSDLRMRLGDDALQQVMPFCFFVLIIKLEELVFSAWTLRFTLLNITCLMILTVCKKFGKYESSKLLKIIENRTNNCKCKHKKSYPKNLDNRNKNRICSLSKVSHRTSHRSLVVIINIAEPLRCDCHPWRKTYSSRATNKSR